MRMWETDGTSGRSSIRMPAHRGQDLVMIAPQSTHFIIRPRVCGGWRGGGGKRGDRRARGRGCRR